MDLSNPLTILRQLKGAPLSILIAIMAAGQPVGETWLSAMTGYNRDTVHLALSYLSEPGIDLVRRNHRYNGWVLCKGVQQLPLVIPNEGNYESDADNIGIPPTTTRSISINQDPQFNEDLVVATGSRKNAHPESEPPDPAILDALHDAGIRDPKAAALASLPGVTLPYVQAHIRQYQLDRQAQPDKIKPGLLIYRIQHGDPAPQPPEDPNDGSRYVTGKYADFIQH